MIRGKKFSFILVLILFALTLISCDKDKPGGKEPNPMKSIEYSQIYRNEVTKKEPLSGKTLYKASYGYSLNDQQGYNNFYYQTYTNNQYLDLTYQNNKWQSNEVWIENGKLCSKTGSNATYKFVCPASGEVNISGNPYLLTGSNATVQIYKNSTMIIDKPISDSYGINHSNKVTVSSGDAIYFQVTGDATVYWNPTIDYTLKTETSLHHAVDGYYGDVHPFYDEKTNRLFMFYLSTGRQSVATIPTFASLLTVSNNFVNYESREIGISPTNPLEQELYYALGVYVDKAGRYRSSFGYGSYAGASVSDDLFTWGQGATPYIDDADGLFKYTYHAYFDSDVYSGRDPDIFYDKDTNQYYLVVMNYYSSAVANGDKGLALYLADSEGRYSTKAHKLLDFTGRGDPECPQLKKIGNRWYLFYSVYGTGTAGNVGKFAYRVGDANVLPQNVNWQDKTEYYLDGGDLHAAQITQVVDKYYMYGWINYKPMANVWGGYLNIAREVYQTEEGLLKTRLDSYLTRLLNKGLLDQTADKQVNQTNYQENIGKYSRTLLAQTIQLPKDANYAGYSVTSNNATYNVVVIRKDGKLYLSITDDLNKTISSTSILINDYDTEEFNLKIVVDNNFIEAFVNDEYGCVANTFLQGSEFTIGLVASGNKINMKDIKIYKLADYDNIFD